MTILKIDTTKLHNNEHYEFMNEADRTITAHTPAAIDIAALYPPFRANLTIEDDSYKIVAKSAYTRTIGEIDVARDSDFNFYSCEESLPPMLPQQALATGLTRLKEATSNLLKL